jgi:uncharacterized protein YggT (Ycf19 family)
MAEHVVHSVREGDIVEDDAATGIGYTLARLVWLIAGVIMFLLAFRFIFILAGANPANGFVNFIYTISQPFARPFFGIFGYNIHYGVSRVEFASLIGIVVYAVVAYILARLLTLSGRPRRY